MRGNRNLHFLGFFLSLLWVAHAQKRFVGWLEFDGTALVFLSARVATGVGAQEKLVSLPPNVAKVALLPYFSLQKTLECGTFFSLLYVPEKKPLQLFLSIPGPEKYWPSCTFHYL